MPDCPDAASLRDRAYERLLTQYRESLNLKALIGNYMQEMALALGEICRLPEAFDLNSAVGDQLTLIGKRLGFPRCHCVCETQTVFGFDCPEATLSIAGFCADGSTWAACGGFGRGEYCIDDDETYRTLLMVRVLQLTTSYSSDSLNSAVALLWGEGTQLISSSDGVAIVPVTTPLNGPLTQIAARVINLAPGIRLALASKQQKQASIFGFGEGFGGFCESPGAEFLCGVQIVDPSTCS